jgi:hypothetical protein
MSSFLKGNFELKNAVDIENKVQVEDVTITEKLKKAAMNSIGGSMVYVERSELTWDGDSDTDEKQSN